MASGLTLYLSNPIQGGASAGLLSLTQPAASTSTTGWTVGSIASGNFSRQTYNVEVPTTNFTATQQPSGAPTGSAQDCWRLSAATTGTFSAGTWYSSVSVIAVTSSGGVNGRAGFRVWRSANADGTSATEITNGINFGTAIAGVSLTVAKSSSMSTQVASFSLSNEFLFLQVAWDILNPGNSSTRDSLIRMGPITDSANGSFLLTPAFTVTSGGGSASGAGFYLHRKQYELVN